MPFLPVCTPSFIILLLILPGYYGRVAPRSGLAVKNFIDVGAGVIDEDYRGPVGVVLFNFSTTPFEVTLSSLSLSHLFILT